MHRSSSWTRIKTGLVLIILMLTSVVPFPITSSLCLYVVIFRPDWFKNLVENIYADKKF